MVSVQVGFPRGVQVAIALLAAAALLGPGVTESSEGTGPTCDVHEIPGVGPACERDDGLFEVFGPDGESLGLTHGPDPIPTGDDGASTLAAVPLACVDPVLQPYHVVIIYARAWDDQDRYASLHGALVDLVMRANGYLHEAAVGNGGTAQIRTVCTNGVPDIANEALPTSMSAASFSTIANNLKSKGYDDPMKKYWVFYDDTGACTCGGMGNIYPDSTPLPTNLNNGNHPLPFFAVTFGYMSPRIMMHELGHNLGAVQNDAPNTTGAFHCTDGYDVMCYNDGGPNAHLYRTVCSVQVWDCNHDDYFHLCPAAGHHLTSHWNLGSNHNRYVTFDKIRVPPVVC